MLCIPTAASRAWFLTHGGSRTAPSFAWTWQKDNHESHPTDGQNWWLKSYPMISNAHPTDALELHKICMRYQNRDHSSSGKPCHLSYKRTEANQHSSVAWKWMLSCLIPPTRSMWGGSGHRCTTAITRGAIIKLYEDDERQHYTRAVTNNASSSSEAPRSKTSSRSCNKRTTANRTSSGTSRRVETGQSGLYRTEVTILDLSVKKHCVPETCRMVFHVWRMYDEAIKSR